MFQVQNLTNDSKQIQTLVLPDGTEIVLSIRFVPMQQGWFITSLTYRGFELDGIRIVNSPNMLYQYKNQIPFGLACLSDSIIDPSLQDDFLSGASKLFVLTEAEVEAYTEYLANG